MRDPDAELYRAITVHAPSMHLFRWLCQLRIAPYSYDWLDNGGRPSPQTLSVGLEALAVGQDVMSIFRLVAFRRDEHLTLRIKSGSRAARIYGDVAGSYVVVPQTDRVSRLLVKLIVRYPSGIVGNLVRMVLPLGDRIMMRRQLLNLKTLAERHW